jgi:hypothetical protein
VHIFRKVEDAFTGVYFLERLHREGIGPLAVVLSQFHQTNAESGAVGCRRRKEVWYARGEEGKFVARKLWDAEKLWVIKEL